jgi:hypothetical protein
LDCFAADACLLHRFLLSLNSSWITIHYGDLKSNVCSGDEDQTSQGLGGLVGSKYQ